MADTIRLRRILWPTDFSELSLKAGHYAQVLAARFEAQLCVLHVSPPLVSPELTIHAVDMAVMPSRIMDASRDRLKELVSKHVDADLDVCTEVIEGDAWREVCRYAEEQHTDLIVISTHGHTGLRHVLLGSTAERVVRHACCPVLTVKAEETDFIE